MYLAEKIPRTYDIRAIEFVKTNGPGLKLFFVNSKLHTLNIWLSTHRFIGRAVFIYESNYPETLKKAYIVNAPSFFPLCWKILRPLLSDCTASKVEIFGKGMSPNQSKLRMS